MSPETWNKINEIFNDAADLPLSQRANFLDENCGSAEIRREVEKLLKAESSANNFLEKPALEFTSKTPKQIGKYRTISELGKGGMGNVYLAEREDMHQKVAVKVIKHGLDSADILRRFKHESEILATLEHPNIARLIDAGTTGDGLPFYAMEFVEGISIDEFCKDKSIEEKLNLFRQICKAVSYSHAKLIVHRDLKPTNIIVNAEGTVKLLDFGIAKILSENNFNQKGTATSLGMMTPNYASPEQIRGEQVTTATDVYSLGIILYELLTGVLPYNLQEKTLDKVIEIIGKNEITKPSSNNSKLKIQNSKLIDSELDNIVLKSLKKESDRRYQSVKDFSEDIRRYLAGLPISARPDTFSYRTTKFFQRNKISIAAASLLFMSLIGGIIGIFFQYQNANRQRALAEKRFADVRELANKVVFRYHDEIAKFPGATALREELVQDAVKYLDSLHAEEIDDNSLKLELARAYQKIGDVQGRPYTANLGKSEDALVSYQKSVNMLERALAKSPNEIELKRELVKSYLRFISLNKRLAVADNEPIDRALKLQIEINQTDSTNPIENALQLAEVYINHGDYYGNDIPGRIEIYKKAADLFEDVADKNLEIHHVLTRANQRIGTNYVWLGDQFAKDGNKEKSLENYRLALPYTEKMFESTKLEIAIGGTTQNLQRVLAGCNQNLGENYLKLGETRKGLEMLQKALEITMDLAKADPKNTEASIDVGNSYISVSDAYEKLGDFQKAITANENALEVFTKSLLADKKNIEVADAIIRRMNQETKLLEQLKRHGDAKVNRQKLEELCKSDIPNGQCSIIGLAK